MIEYPLWQRQRDALAAEQEHDFWQTVAPEYIRPDGSFVHVRDTRLADLQWAPQASSPEPPIAWSDTPRPDALTGLLRAAVAAQDGRCLMCNQRPARYCGMYCAAHQDSAPNAAPGICWGCGDAGVLYCSGKCAARGR